MFLIWFVLIALIVWFWWGRGCGWRQQEVSGIERARTILAERYARGEISVQEYRERHDLLEQAE